MLIFKDTIDFQKYGIEVISDAYKFILPVPKLQEKLTIRNHTDQSDQKVPVDGTGVIIFNFSSKEDAENISPRIKQLINEQLANQDIKILTAQHIRNIVDEAHNQLGLNDIYPTNKDFVQTDLRPVSSHNNETQLYGLYQRNKADHCRAVYIKGSGEFKGPTIQKFEGSAVIVMHRGNCRLVQTSIFLKTYKNKDHSEIQESELQKKQLLTSQLKKLPTHVERLVSSRSDNSKAQNRLSM